VISPTSRALAVLVYVALLHAQPATLNRHPVNLDSDGKLLSWVRPQSAAYDQVMRRAWDFLLDSVQTESNGLKTFYTYCCVDPEKMRGTAWPHNPAGLYAMLADSAAAYYAYSGDHRVVDVVRGLLDYQIAHGTTPAGWKWARSPYASSDHGATEYRGAFEFQYDRQHVGRGDGYGVIEPDKVGELGFGYLKFYGLTGDEKYRNAAIACGDALARNVREGTAEHSPWPFRVYAETGLVREEYSANVIGPIRLLDELIRISAGNGSAYRAARQIAWKWLMEVPMKNGIWVNYFEDIPFMDKLWNLNQYSPMETARYLMDHPHADPEWRAHVAALIDFVEKTFAVDFKESKGVQWGANAISEQLDYMPKMGSHTSRYASVQARWAEVTGDAAAKEKAYRSLNWATYMSDEHGVVNDQPYLQHAGVWFSDGYGDYIRHFMYAVGAQPDWAPPGENHLLRSSSVVSDVRYDARSISYRTFDKDSEEVLRIAFIPTAVRSGGTELAKQAHSGAPGWQFDPGSGVLRIRHMASGDVEVVR
jgi:hypothetical protein